MVSTERNKLVEVHFLQLNVTILSEGIMKRRLKHSHNLEIFLFGQHCPLLLNLLLSLILILQEIHTYQYRAYGNERLLFRAHLWEHLRT